MEIQKFLTVIRKAATGLYPVPYYSGPNFVQFITNECTSDCLKINIKFYIKMVPTCFGAVTQYSVSSLSVLAKVTLC